MTTEYKSSLLDIEDADNVNADAWFSFVLFIQTKTTHIRSQCIIGTAAALLERKNHSVETPYPAAIIGGLDYVATELHQKEGFGEVNVFSLLVTLILC